MALFVDPEFFDDQTIQIISTACNGFVTLLDSLYAERMLYALPTADRGYKVQPEENRVELKKKLKRLGVRFVHEKDGTWRGGLTFTKLKSVDLQVM
jgi:hypothetical protein